MEKPPIGNEKAPHHPNSTPGILKRGPNKRQKALADGVILKGKPFKQSALEAGYSPKVATLGPAFMRKHSVGIDMAFVEAAKQSTFTQAELLALSKTRLISDISRGKSSGVAREIETLGRFKDNDWFVRSGDVQIGIFTSLGDDLKTLDIEVTPELPE